MASQGKNVGSQELEELKHRAYSREGTAQDRDRLAELEAALIVTESPEPSETIVENAETTDDPAETSSDEAPPGPIDGRTGWLQCAGIIAAIAIPALLVGGLVGFGLGARSTSEQVVSMLQEQTEAGIPGLRLFDREDAGGEPLTFDVEQVTGLVNPVVRDVAMVDSSRVLVSRGPNAFGEIKVCLISSTGDTQETACSTQEEFIDGRGLALGVGGFIIGWLPSTDMLLIAPL